MRYASLAADAILVLHVLFVAFVLLGQVVIVIGLVARWAWVRHFWFRVVHLAAILVVVLESWFGIVCPLTRWENQLRAAAGESGNQAEGFIATWLHRCLFYDNTPGWVFTAAYTTFGALVVLTWIFGRPQRTPRGLRPPGADDPRASA